MKNIFRSIVLASAISLSVGGCGKTVQDAYQVATQAKVPASTIIVALSGFDAIKITATNYLRQPICSSSSTSPICLKVENIDVVDAAISRGTQARNRLKTFLRSHPDELGIKGDYDAVVEATNTLTDITAAYSAARNLK